MRKQYKFIKHNKLKTDNKQAKVTFIKRHNMPKYRIVKAVPYDV